MFQQLLILGGIGLVAGLATIASPTNAVERLPDGAYSIDAVHSSVLFSAVHFGASRFYGRFNKVSGELTFDPEHPEKSTIRVEIDAASVDTNDEKRDQHLSGPDFFASKEFQTMTFTSESVLVARKGTDELPLQLEVAGKLDMLGKKRDVTALVDLVGAGPGMRGSELVGFHTRFEIQRSNWGMDTMLGPLSDAVEVLISVEANR